MKKIEVKTEVDLELMNARPNEVKDQILANMSTLIAHEIVKEKMYETMERSILKAEPYHRDEIEISMRVYVTTIEEINEMVKLISYIRSCLPIGFQTYADRLLKIITDEKRI